MRNHIFYVFCLLLLGWSSALSSPAVAKTSPLITLDDTHYVQSIIGKKRMLRLSNDPMDTTVEERGAGINQFIAQLKEHLKFIQSHLSKFKQQIIDFMVRKHWINLRKTKEAASTVRVNPVPTKEHGRPAASAEEVKPETVSRSVTGTTHETSTIRDGHVRPGATAEGAEATHGGVSNGATGTTARN
ncbi:hypothetical protein PsorP6_014474 [Peronosclerospora sorghi]|uniref:Uncharacterized protein n=1 Tax=Peronosclerospora sorghi TaxID=230839 RepID=A0ACC0VRK1_9STRA|nr:hypothetical protein PsorP6_014474 [Peronosclerospora sorghi]